MFFTTLQTNRQHSIGGFYFLYFLFLLHLCTAFFTIISAFHNEFNDNEAIIQLSMDSIHVVKSSDPQIMDVEETKHDNEEKELVVALLASYKDESKINKQIDTEASVVNPSTSIHFIPDSLYFAEQPIAVPQMRQVLIINYESEPLELYSLTGTTNEFYSSFKQTILSPNGGSTSINIYYLPRKFGITENVFQIKTDRGNFPYNVSGIGILNPFRLRPLVNAVIPLGSTFEHTVRFYNPYNYPLEINEIYTSDENLIIELLPDENRKNKITKVFEHHKQWRLQPFEHKSIVKINYIGYKLNQLQGFICIKTNFSDIIIIPVEINVSNRPGLYSQVDLFELTNERFLRAVAKPLTKPFYVFNYGSDPVIITDVIVTPEHRNYITIQHKNLPIPSDINRLNQIADITINPNSIPDNIHHIHGYIQVYTSSNTNQPALGIPFDEQILHGSLDYSNDNIFHIPFSSKEVNHHESEQCQPIKFLNHFNTTIAVHNITTDKETLLSEYIKIQRPSYPLYLHPNEWTELICVYRLKQPLLSNIQSMVDIHTNLSFFNFDIQLYNGLLDINVFIDTTNNGIKRDKPNTFDLSITSIPVDTTRTVTFALTNPNPVDIKIDKFSFTLPNTNIQIEYIRSLDENPKKIASKTNDISQLIIPKQHQVVFSLTINGKSPAMHHNETITFHTQYQIVRINVKYDIINGSLEFINKTPLHIDVFTNRIGTSDIFVHNKFNETLIVTHMDFISYGTCFSFTWTNRTNGRVELESNKIQKVGRLNFDINPLCKASETLSESTCFCGLHHHPEFKQRWDEHVNILNAYELDYTLVNKFRNLWKEWTSLVRKQKIQSNIWLYTNRANISWPVTIGFVWPSVLEHMSPLLSRTPITHNFQITPINTIKTQNIIITNPSSDLVTYSVRLLYNDLDKIDQSFTLSTTSKRVVFKNNIYNFNLPPNDHITFIVTYRPTSLTKHELYFIVQNNFTTIESILLRGEGGFGNLQVGNRKPGSSLIPLILEIDEKQHNLCSNIHENTILRKTVTIQNTGNMKTVIHDILFGRSKCSGRGFSASICTNIEIDSYDKYELKILFQPDYTSDEINETLILNTNIGIMTIPIIVRIPQFILSTCYKTIPRPPWEFRTYSLWLCILLVIIVLIFVSAIYDSRRLFDNYLTRAEWRNNVQTTNNKIFDLSDLSSAVHDEQKTRERIESHSISDTKKEKIVEPTKHEVKRKRSINNNEETPVKPVRTSDSSSSAVRSSVTTPKTITTTSKPRRATLDNGPAKVPSKPQQDPPTKVLPIRRQKSEQSTRPVSSSAVSDEENEPFVVARTRRLSSKTKSTTTDNTPAVSSKSSSHSNPSDQQNLLKADDSTNNQQRQRVSSNKSQRKGSTPKRETTDESQTSNKPVKRSSITIEPPVISSSSSYIRSSLSDESSQTHSTPNPLPITVPILIDKNSLQNEISLIDTKRNDDEEEENIEWDEPDAPDDDFGRYVSQTDYTMDELNDINEANQTQQQNTKTTNNIPSLMSLTITPPIMTTTIQQKPTVSPSVTKENIEPLPFPQQHGPGPIQRPNKLSSSSITQIPPFLAESTQSPSTPDVLVQINHLLDHQNSISNSSTLVNDTTTPNVPWTPFSSTEWPSWSSASIQNPFTQRQISKDDAFVWSNTASPNPRTWNEVFPSTGTSSMETTKQTWLKFLPISDSASADGKQENETNNPFWSSINLNENNNDDNNNDQSRWDFAR